MPDSLLPSYTHIVNPKLKYIYLSFGPKGELIIKSPKVSQRDIENILLKRAAWITKSRRRVLEKKGRPIEFEEGEELYFLGRSYPVAYKQDRNKRASIKFTEEEGFFFLYQEFDKTTFEELINEFYKKEAKRVIPKIVEKYSKLMQLYPSRISFRKARGRWGSCSSSNAISFNYLMMKLPMSTIEYIVVHELTHIKHKHHQKEFWSLLSTYLPDYKAEKEILKSYM